MFCVSEQLSSNKLFVKTAAPQDTHSQTGTYLVGAFNPSEKYACQIGSSPQGSG